MSTTKKLMQFRIWHLLLFVLIMAFSCLLYERYFHRTVTFVVESVKPHSDLYLKIGFSVTNPDSLAVERVDVLAKYGENSFFKKHLSSDSLANLNETKVDLRYRCRGLPWAEKEDWRQRFLHHFPSPSPEVLYQVPKVEGTVFPKAEGTVLRIGSAGNFVVKLDSDDGVRVDHTMDIYRKDRFIGKGTVVKTQKDLCVLKVVKEHMTDSVKEGDWVMRNQNSPRIPSQLQRH